MTFHPRQRIQHKTLGPGTVTEVDGDAVRVELDSDDGARVRVFMASLGTIEPETQASGAAPCASSTASAAAAATALTSPPLAAVAERPAPPPRSRQRAGTDALAADHGNPSPAPAETQARRVPQTKPKPSPRSATKETTPMPDALVTAMNVAIAERGKGSGAALCATLGLAGGSYKNWRHAGRIPENHRAGVQAWIDKPQVVAVRVEKSKPAQQTKTKAAKPAIKIPSPTPMPPIRRAIDHGTVLQALGLTITTAWLPDGETMRQVRVAVLP
jgi:hypothetical protein